MVKDSNIFDIDTPALLIDLDGVEKNLDTMQKKADASSALLRPHIKAHKIPELARTQVRLGAVGITASKVSEAEVMPVRSSICLTKRMESGVEKWRRNF